MVGIENQLWFFTGKEAGSEPSFQIHVSGALVVGRAIGNPFEMHTF